MKTVSDDPPPSPIQTLRYCDGLWERVRRRKHGGMIISGPNVDSKAVVQSLRVISRVLGVTPNPELETSLVGDIPYVVDHMASNLADDVAQHVETTPFVLRFLPTAKGNAYCTQHDELGRLLDRPLVVLHHGLIFASLRLSSCIVLENLQGELAEYRTDATRFFLRAAQSYRAREMKGSLSETFSTDTFADTEIAAYSGAIAARLLKFIAWHELGHIANGDLTRVSVEDGAVTEEASAERNRAQERLADVFATETLIRSSSSPGAAWRNASPVYLFFRWLQAVYNADPSLRDISHPEPFERADSLRESLLERAPGGEPEHFDWIDSRIPHWRRDLPSALQQDTPNA